jgi:chemotaxis protein MotB
MGQGRRARLILALALLGACGSKPAPQAPDPRIAQLEAELTSTKDALAKEKEAADSLRTKDAELEAKAAEAKALEDKLAEAVGKYGEVTTADGAVKLELVDQILFPLGEADLTPQGKEVLAKVGAALKETDKQIWVQGHTDNQPIRFKDGVDTRFDSNWELSAARALTVVHYLEDNVGVDPKRLAAVAFGEHRPAAKAKAKNRRIEIVLYPRHEIAKKI